MCTFKRYRIKGIPPKVERPVTPQRNEKPQLTPTLSLVIIPTTHISLPPVLVFSPYFPMLFNPKISPSLTLTLPSPSLSELTTSPKRKAFLSFLLPDEGRFLWPRAWGLLPDAAGDDDAFEEP